MSVQIWEHFFKPEVRSSGRTLFSQGKTSVAQPSDTEVIVFIRVSSPLKVVLKSKSVSSNTLTVDCNCPAGKKGLFCKHIWAGLLATDQKNPDFFDSKTEIQKAEAVAKIAAAEKPKPTAQSQAREAAQEAYKEKQTLYRKIQYQKQKLRQKQYKLKKEQAEEVSFPRDVEKALQYFSQNGFELRDSLNLENVGMAKKKLARIFHPDLGGSHEEIQELNKYSDVLTNYTQLK